MSISETMAVLSKSKLVIPYPSRMYWSNITRRDKALCFVLNRGYFEAPNCETILCILDDIQSDTVKFIGSIEKVQLKSGVVVYRQFVVFKSLKAMLNLCRASGVSFELGKDFHITLDSMENCFSEMKTMKQYASKFREPVDVWLTNCCIIHINELSKGLHFSCNLDDRVNRILYKRNGYLDRSPFLLSSINKEDRKSVFFVETDINDGRLYSMRILDKNDLVYGYTTANVKKDKKKGVLTR